MIYTILETVILFEVTTTGEGYTSGRLKKISTFEFKAV